MRARAEREHAESISAGIAAGLRASYQTLSRIPTERQIDAARSMPSPRQRCGLDTGTPAAGATLSNTTRSSVAQWTVQASRPFSSGRVRNDVRSSNTSGSLGGSLWEDPELESKL